MHDIHRLFIELKKCLNWIHRHIAYFKNKFLETKFILFLQVFNVNSFCHVKKLPDIKIDAKTFQYCISISIK